MSRDALVEAAATAFADGSWEEAHRRYAELLSVDGENVAFQWHYAATLLHDARRREEGFQRLATMNAEGELHGEAWYWWGEALRMVGEPFAALDAYGNASANWKVPKEWRQRLAHAEAVAAAMPEGHAQRLFLEVVDASAASRGTFQRLVTLRAPFRLAARPQNLLTKRDEASTSPAAMVFSPTSDRVFFHRRAKNGHEDLWEVAVDEAGRLTKPSILPEPVNSPYDDVNPVWVEAEHALYFSSNRPGSMGGFDVWRTERTKNGWSDPVSLSPDVNSVFNEWAWFPHLASGELDGIEGSLPTSWLVTDRESGLMEVGVWEVEVSEPQTPVAWVGKWEVEDASLPGTLRVTDAATDRLLARLEVAKNTGVWPVSLAAGGVYNVGFDNGHNVRALGTFALPEAANSYVATQTLQLDWVAGRSVMRTSNLRMSSPSDGAAMWSAGTSEQAANHAAPKAPVSSQRDSGPRPDERMEEGGWLSVSMPDAAQPEGLEPRTALATRPTRPTEEVLRGLRDTLAGAKDDRHMSFPLAVAIEELLARDAIDAPSQMEVTAWSEAVAVVNRWHSEEGQLWTPDDAFAQLESWPPSLDAVWEEVKGTFATGRAAKAEVVAVLPVMQGPAPQWPMVASPTQGMRGIQVGWFRNEPQFGPLPTGTRLHRQAGDAGIDRWVLVLDSGVAMNEGISRWLQQGAVHDAFEVHWTGEGWTKHRPDDPSATDAARLALGASPSTAPKPNVAANLSSDARTRPAGKGPADASDLWVHGRPVELGELVGSWYAVQVGAFRGEPEKPWVESAGERLVFEAFEDGLKRWYAGVREDRSLAEARLAELRSRPDFADAFLVRLSEGRREPATPTNVSEARNAGEETATAGPEAHPTSSQSTAVADPRRVRVNDASVTWHVDIAKYFGTVPAGEVAVLLLRSGDWGVRNWTLQGQTTYFTRSFDNLEEATRVLEEIQSEGFVGAELVRD